jgi:glycosyltransferase involved in cell wall biosynthesis
VLGVRPPRHRGAVRRGARQGGRHSAGRRRGFRPRPPEETAGCSARYGLVPGFLFALGRLNRRKNLERLLLAYGRLREAGVSDAPLVIGGKPDYGVDEVLRRARLSPDSRAVRFMGLIPDADLPHFYGGAACFVYPSLFEGFGLPLIEAMACGTPVVSSDRSAMPEVVDAAGLLVDPENVDAIADAIARVLSDADSPATSAGAASSGAAATPGPRRQAAPSRLSRSRPSTAVGSDGLYVTMSGMPGDKPGLRVALLGTRGVPASYSGFETCAEELGARLAPAGTR